MIMMQLSQLGLPPHSLHLAPLQLCIIWPLSSWYITPSTPARDNVQVRSGRQVILVTSGAVCVGRQVLRQQHILNSSPLQMMGNHNFCGEPRSQLNMLPRSSVKSDEALSIIQDGSQQLVVP